MVSHNLFPSLLLVPSFSSCPFPFPASFSAYFPFFLLVPLLFHPLSFPLINCLLVCCPFSLSLHNPFFLLHPLFIYLHFSSCSFTFLLFFCLLFTLSVLLFLYLT